MSTIHSELAAKQTTHVAKTTSYGGGLRRSRSRTKPRIPALERKSRCSCHTSKDHTSFMVTSVTKKKFRAFYSRIPIMELKFALWKDDRAPIPMSLLFTSMSSILIGIAFATHKGHVGSGSTRIDDGFYTLLSDTLIQLCSIYILLLPILRGQEPRIKRVWFCFSVLCSIFCSIASCIVYAFSWHASALLRFAGSLASMNAALLLVQSIDKGNTPRESEDVSEEA